MPILIISVLIGASLGILQLYFSYTVIIVTGCIPLYLFYHYIFPHIREKLKTLWLSLNQWHFLWLLLLFSGFVFRQRDATSSVENPLDVWALYRVCLVAVIGIVLFYQLTIRHTNWLSQLFRGPIGGLGLCALLSLTSTLWSVYPAWTLYKSVEYFIDVALISAIALKFKTFQGMKSFFDWTWLLLTSLLVSTWTSAVFWPDDALSWGVGAVGLQIKGVFPMISSNNVGELSAIVAAVSLTRYLTLKTGGFFYLLPFAFGLLTLIVSQTRSALAGFSLAILVLLLTTKRFGILAFSPLLLALIIVATPANKVFLEFIQRGQDTEDISTFTGRTVWWGGAWNSFLEQPFSGYGAYAAGRFLVLDQQGLGETSSLHSTWMEVLVGLGLPGILLVLGSVIWIWTILVFFLGTSDNQAPVTRLTIEAIVVFSIISVRSIFESALIWHPAIQFLLIAGFSEFLRQAKKVQFGESPSYSQLLSTSGR